MPNDLDPITLEQGLVALPNLPSKTCPRCRSIDVELHHPARRVGGAIGTIAGATGGVALMWSGAEAGATLGALAGPAGAAVGAITGMLVAAVVGGTSGCAAGAALGNVIDENILDTHHCLSCGHMFSGYRPE